MTQPIATRPRIPTLVVDDTPLNLKLVSALLGGSGFDVTMATTAEDALRKLATGRFALLLLDLHLPGMDGLALARTLRATPEHAGMRIVAITANVATLDEAQALAAGCDAFLQKPVNTRTFVPALRAILDQPK